MLGVTFDLGGYISALTTMNAAIVFWSMFAVAIAVAALVIGGRPRPRKRTRTYDLPPQQTSARRAAELYRSSRASTRSTISPDKPT